MGGKVDVVVCGQYDSEGKEKIVACLSPKYDMCIRTGGPNTGCTVKWKDKEYKLRAIPSGFIN